MGWTKRQLIDDAFGTIGLSGYVFNLSPDQKQAALRKLDAMMATWEARGLRIGYLMPSSPSESDLDQDSGIPNQCAEAVYSNLGLRLGSSIGKVPSQDLKVIAHQAYQSILTKYGVSMPEMQLPHTMPRGAGNKPTRNEQFMSEPVEVQEPEAQLPFRIRP